MLNAVCNRDLPETMFDVKDGVVLHVAKSLEDAVQYSAVDVMILVDDGWKTRKYLKSVEFEALVAHNPDISFVACTNHNSILNFVNDMMEDYDNLDTISVREMPYVTITDRPTPIEKPQPLLDQLNSWFERLIDPHKKVGVA